IAGGLHELADQRLARAVRVAVGGVDEVPAGREVALEDRARPRLCAAPTPFGSERHRAQTEWRDAQPAAAERVVGGEAVDRFGAGCSGHGWIGMKVLGTRSQSTVTARRRAAELRCSIRRRAS